MSTSTVSVVLIGAFPQDVTLIRGGVEATVYGLAKALKARQDVSGLHIIALPSKDAQTWGSKVVEGLDVLYLKPTPLLMLGIVHLPAILRQIPAGAVAHVHGTGLLQLALLVALRLQRRKAVWTLHGIAAKETLQSFRRDKTLGNGLRYMLYAALERLMVWVSPHSIVDTPYVVQAVGLKGNVSVIPVGIFTEEFTSVPQEVRRAPVVLSIGVMSARKGHHLTIEAFAQVVKNIPQAQLIIAGAVTDKVYYEKIQQQIKHLRLENHVSLRLNVPRPELLRLFAQARIFVLHSEEESQGVALCEAFASGLPVVATDVGGIACVVTQGKEGLLVRFHDTEAFAGAMVALLGDSALCQRMAKFAKISARRFDWKNVAEEVMIVYQTL